MGRKYRHETEQADGWSRWVQPVMKGYKMACCDCGLVHDMEFRALQKGRDQADGTWMAKPLGQKAFRVEFRARRNVRSTAAVRRHKK
jgi:hypothetical protein